MNFKQTYREGDRVVLKPKALLEKEFEIGCAGYFREEVEPHLVGSDRVVEIQRGPGDCNSYEVKLPDGKRRVGIFGDGILGYAFEWNEEIEVSFNGEAWSRSRFRGYIPGTEFPVAAKRPNELEGLYKYARPLSDEGEDLSTEEGMIEIGRMMLKHLEEEKDLVNKWIRDKLKE